MATRGQVLFYAKLTKPAKPQDIISFRKLPESKASSVIGQLQAKRGKKGALRK